MKYSLLIGAALLVLPCFAGADTVRPAVGKPLQQAEVLIARHNYNAALQQVNKASAVAGLTLYESLVIAELRGTSAAGAGDYAQAAAAYQIVLNSGTITAAAQLQYVQAIAGFYDQARDYPHTVIWVGRYIAAGGSDPVMRVLLPQAYYQQGDYSHAEQAVWRDQRAAAKADRTLPESELQLLASSAEKSGDQAGYAAALAALLAAYPNPQYWAASIAVLMASPGFPDALVLDTDRLRLATGTLTQSTDYEDYAERAILANDPAEANAVVGQGFAKGILTNQTDAGHAARLQGLAAKEAANAPTVPAAELQQAQAAAKAGSPNAGLDLGIADYQAGNPTAAIQSFASVQASSAPSAPAFSLASLWRIYVQDTAHATIQAKDGA